MQSLDDELLHRAIRSLGPEQRKEALYSLSMIGLQHYMQECDTSHIDIRKLRLLYDDAVKSIQEQKIAYGRNLEGILSAKSEIATMLRSEESKSPQLSAINTSYPHKKATIPLQNIYYPPNRIPRPDAMAHFPFADDRGKVTDVLTNDTQEIGKFLGMGIPAQKKVVKRVFDEMKSGVLGILVIDLPDAIKNLGLYVSLDLEHVFKGTETTIAGNKTKKLVLSKPQLSYQEFQALVDRYVEVLLSGAIDEVDPSYLVTGISPVLPIPTCTSSYHHNLHRHSHHQLHNDEQLESNSHIPSPPSNRPHMPLKSDKTSSKTTSSSGSYIAKSISPTSFGYKDNHTSRIRQTQSKIKQQVAHDRMRYKHDKHQLEQPAIEIIAQHRIDEILSSSSSTDSSMIRSASSKRYDDLTSGSSALAIAEAFLNSSVAKEIANQHHISMMSTDQHHHQSTSPIDDDYHLAAAKLHSNSNHHHDDDSSSSSSNDHHHRSGWEHNHTKSGWVADFGAAHTMSMKPGYSPTRSLLSSTDSAKNSDSASMSDAGII